MIYKIYKKNNLKRENLAIENNYVFQAIFKLAI